MKKKLTLAEIAKMADVNPSTVSRVLHQDPKAKISAPVRKKILRICDKYNYRPSATARSVASGLTYRVGLILGALEQDLASPTLSLFIRGLCDELQKNHYTLSILWAEHPDGTRDQQVADFLMSDIADGYVLGSTMLESEITEKLKDMKRPLAYLANNIAYHPEGISGVYGTAVNACKQIWQMIRPDQYGKIIYVCGQGNEQKISDMFCAADELHIRRSAVKQYNLNEKTTDFPFDRHNAAEWAEHHLDLLKKQKIIWCGSDLTALGIADILKKNGIRPGRDVGLIGYDNIENSRRYREEPVLTTIDNRQESMGKQLAQMLLAMIRGENTHPVTIPVEAELIIRQTFNNTIV